MCPRPAWKMEGAERLADFRKKPCIFFFVLVLLSDWPMRNKEKSTFCFAAISGILLGSFFFSQRRRLRGRSGRRIELEHDLGINGR